MNNKGVNELSLFEAHFTKLLSMGLFIPYTTVNTLHRTNFKSKLIKRLCAQKILNNLILSNGELDS